jgi:hypothetical protein
MEPAGLATLPSLIVSLQIFHHVLSLAFGPRTAIKSWMYFDRINLHPPVA